MNVKSKKWKKLNRTQVALVERWIFCIELTLYLWSRLSQVQFAVAFFSECGRFSEAQKIRSSCRVRRKYIFVDTGGGFFSSLHASNKSPFVIERTMEKCCIILPLHVGSVRVKDVDSTTDKIRTPKFIVDLVDRKSGMELNLIQNNCYSFAFDVLSSLESHNESL